MRPSLRLAGWLLACALPRLASGACAVAAIDAAPGVSLAATDDGLTWGWGQPAPLGLGPSEPIEVSGVFGAVMLAASSNHALALLPDGTVVAWGWNPWGELGPGAAMGSVSAPTTVTDGAGVPLAGVRMIAAGEGHSLALLGDGTVLSWGRNDRGQLGRDTAGAASDPVPAPVASLGGIMQIDAAGWRSMALGSDGAAWSWGDAAHGEMGNGGTGSQSRPVQAFGLPPAMSIAAGRWHSLALVADGSVWAWGSNFLGAVGPAVPAGGQALAPVPVNGATGATKIAAGDDISLALLADGSVIAWGDNAFGAVGGAAAGRVVTVPTVVPLPSAALRLAAGGGHVIALLDDSSLRAWGLNMSGEIGLEPPVDLAVPRQVTLPAAAVAIDASRDDQSFALLADGRVAGWGDDAFGELGLGEAGGSHPLPQDVPALAGVSRVASGLEHSLALRSDGQVIAWGENWGGQLGDGAAFARLTPDVVPGASVVTEIASGRNHAIALRDDGSVLAWGFSPAGQAGDGTVGAAVRSPVLVQGASAATRVVAGFEHALAVRAGGEVVAWGSNDAGQLGDGSTQSRATAVVLSGVSAPVALAAGDAHSLAVLSDGTLLAWGDSSLGQLGLADSAIRTRPTVIPGFPPDLISVAAGSGFSLGLRADGSVIAWGDTGLAGAQRVPLHHWVTVQGLPPIVAIAAGRRHAIALGRDGSAWTWGETRRGQAGVGLAAWSAAPVDPGFHGPARNVGGTLRVVKQAGEPRLSWARTASAEAFNVKRSMTPLAAGFATVATVTVPAHLDAPPAGATWYYVVTAVDCLGGEGP